MSKPKLVVPHKKLISRRSALKLGAAGATAAVMGPGYVRYAQAQSSEPIRIGFQVHRTGIGVRGARGERFGVGRHGLFAVAEVEHHAGAVG